MIAKSSTKAPQERDITVIGGSAGCLEPLRDLVAQIHPATPTAGFVVVHVLPSSTSRLPEILSRSGLLPVRHARDRDGIEPGRILVAPPDRHLLLHQNRVELNRGPRENSTRPAIDPLFRSAAAAFGPRVCGVILSGNLDDGSEGLRLVAAAGGLALVQDPEEAAHREMPLNALRRVPDAVVLTAARIGERLCGEEVGSGDPRGAPSGLTCPECGGVLWAGPDSESLHCWGGHRYSLKTLAEQQDLAVGPAMWAAIRSLQEDARIVRNLAERARNSGSTLTATRYDRRHRDIMRHADVLRRLLAARGAADELSPS